MYKEMADRKIESLVSGHSDKRYKDEIEKIDKIKNESKFKVKINKSMLNNIIQEQMGIKYV
jgi:hypothetical protein